jgi:YARHG domain
MNSRWIIAAAVLFLLVSMPRRAPAPIQEVTESPTPTATPTLSVSPAVPAPVSSSDKPAGASSSALAWPGEMFPETRTRILKTQDVSSWDGEKFRYAINEMYARGGYDFRSPEIKQVFLRFPWYRDRLVNGRSQDEAFMHLSSMERANLELLQNMRRPAR